jgi:uncharacterized protein
MSSGALDVSLMLATLEVTVRPEDYVYAALPPGHPVLALAAATVTETEGTTAVLTREQADTAEIEYDFVAAWISLTVHSSLEAVGLTAAFSSALAEAGISCNVLAGFYHDHLLVPVRDRDRALLVLHDLRAAQSGGAATS